jgi:hypothetical protein
MANRLFLQHTRKIFPPFRTGYHCPVMYVLAALFIVTFLVK